MHQFSRHAPIWWHSGQASKFLLSSPEGRNLLCSQSHKIDVHILWRLLTNPYWRFSEIHSYLLKASSYLLSHLTITFFLSNLTNGKHLLVHFNIRTFKVAILMFSCWTSFKLEGGFIFIIVAILFGFASFPWDKTNYLKKNLDSIPIVWIWALKCKLFVFENCQN